MDNKFFGIDPDQRSTIPSAKRATGFSATQEPFEYINQALFELKTDHIIGTAAQLALDQCTCKYQSSDQTLRDSAGAAVTLSDGDRVYITGLDLLTADFDLSTYDRLRVISDPSITLANGSYNLEFGDECFFDINVSSIPNLIRGSSCYGFVNKLSFTSAIVTKAFWQVVNGYGSSSTKIQKFTTEVDASDDVVVTVDNSATLGFTVTANMKCNLHITFGSHANSAAQYGISKNSTQLTTGISTITVADRMVIDRQAAANNSEYTSWEGVLEIGDVIRTHTEGIATGSNPSQGSVTVVATAV
jgi:hypothetical protein